MGKGGMMGQTTQKHATTSGTDGTKHHQTAGKTTPGTMHGPTGTHGTKHEQTAQQMHDNMHAQAGTQNQPTGAAHHPDTTQNPGTTP